MVEPYVSSTMFELSAQGNPGPGTVAVEEAAGGWGTMVHGNTRVDDDSWHHVCAARRTDGNISIYVYGNLDNSPSSTGRNPTAMGPAFIGSRGAAEGYSFTGLIDEAALYGRALTPEEIQRLFQGAPAVAEGQHVISYRSSDNAGNTEAAKAQTAVVDETPPATEFSLLGPQAYLDPPPEPLMTDVGLSSATTTYFLAGSTSSYTQPATGRSPRRQAMASMMMMVSGVPGAEGIWLNFITGETQLQFASTDACSGVAETRYSVDGAVPDVLYTPPARLAGPDGLYTVKYRSLDRLGHWEAIKSSMVYLDNTAPASSLEIAGWKWDAGRQIYVSSTSLFSITADDGKGSGVGRIVYTMSGPGYSGGEQTYTGPFTLDAGTHTVWYAAEDRVGNRSAARQVPVTITEDLPPVSSAERQEEAAKKAAEFYRRVTDKLKSDEERQYKGIYNNSPENRWKNNDFYRPRENRP